MKSTRSISRILVWLGAAAVALMGAGCANIFVPKHKVLVDAITAPNTPKPTGQSYRLVAKSSVVASVPVQVAVVKACIDAALTGLGMFEAPANVPPDMYIEVSYGNDAGPRVDPATRETFLQLSARANPGRSLDRATGPELWDVRVGVLGLAGRAESVMPLLSAVAANYVATDTKMESKVEVPKNEPSVAAVRETAIKALEARGTPAPANAAPGSSPTGGPSSGSAAGPENQVPAADPQKSAGPPTAAVAP